MNELVQQQIMQLVLTAMQGDQKAQQLIEQMKGQTQSARNGAKLNYLKSLLNQCPEGQELAYFKVGGKVCSKCMKAKLEAQKASCGTKVKKVCGGGVSKVMNGIKAEMKACGGKTKKK